MISTWDPILIINLILCLIIFIYGYSEYKMNKKIFPLYIGLAFALFGVSHLANLLGMQKNNFVTDILIAVRMVAYLLVIWALSKLKKDKSSEF